MVTMHSQIANGALHKAPGASNRSLPSESGAEDARTPNANAWSADSTGSAKRLDCVRFIGAFGAARDGLRFMAALHGFGIFEPDVFGEGAERDARGACTPHFFVSVELMAQRDSIEALTVRGDGVERGRGGVSRGDGAAGVGPAGLGQIGRELQLIRAATKREPV